MALGATPSSLPFRLVLPPAVGPVFTNHHRGSWSFEIQQDGFLLVHPFATGPAGARPAPLHRQPSPLEGPAEFSKNALVVEIHQHHTP